MQRLPFEGMEQAFKQGLAAAKREPPRLELQWLKKAKPPSRAMTGLLGVCVLMQALDAWQRGGMERTIVQTALQGRSASLAGMQRLRLEATPRHAGRPGKVTGQACVHLQYSTIACNTLVVKVRYQAGAQQAKQTRLPLQRGEHRAC